MKKVERNKHRKKVNANNKAFAFHLYNCPKEPVSTFVNALDDCLFIEEYRRIDKSEEEYYHYHPDHLGSSSWITDPEGRPVQHIQYLPFGETWADQRSANWNAPYTFSGKEKDWETSYHYYGARYYDSEISIWLGPDPLRDKYPSLSPYVYCADNPIKLIDPDGRDWFENELTGDVYYNSLMGEEFIGNCPQLSGEGWKHMGGNDMFGTVDGEFIQNNREFLNSSDSHGKSFGAYDANGNYSTEYEMNFGSNSKAFMNKMGYDFKPKEAIATITETKQIVSEPHTPIYLSEKSESIYPVLSGTYVKKGTDGSYMVLNKSVTDEFKPLFSTTTTRERRIYDYSKSPQKNYDVPIKAAGEIMKNFWNIIGK